MRRQWFGFKFGMELAAQEPRMTVDLDDFDKVLVRGHAGNNEPMIGEDLFELTVEFVTMSVSFGDDG